MRVNLIILFIFINLSHHETEKSELVSGKSEQEKPEERTTKQYYSEAVLSLESREPQSRSRDGKEEQATQ